jgi:hypothetical protein
MCPENHVERGTQRGTLTPVLGPQKRRENKVVPTQIDELIDKVNRKFCETLFDDEAISEQNLAPDTYKQGWRTYRLAVCGDCIKAGGAQ